MSGGWGASWGGNWQSGGSWQSGGGQGGRNWQSGGGQGNNWQSRGHQGGNWPSRGGHGDNWQSGGGPGNWQSGRGQGNTWQSESRQGNNWQSGGHQSNNWQSGGGQGGNWESGDNEGRDEWRSGGNKGGSASGYSYFHGPSTGTRNTNSQGWSKKPNNQGGWNQNDNSHGEWSDYSVQDWGFQQDEQPQWSTAADDQDWNTDMNGQGQNTSTGWRDADDVRGPTFQNNSRGGQGGKRGRWVGNDGVGQRKRQNNAGGDGRFGKRRQRDFGPTWRNHDYNYNYYDESEYGNESHDNREWGEYRGGRGHDGYGGYERNYNRKWSQIIPGRNSSWVPRDSDYYNEEDTYSYDFDFGGDYEGGYEDPQDYYTGQGGWHGINDQEEEQVEWTSRNETEDDKLLYKKHRTLTQIGSERKSLISAVRNIMNAMKLAGKTMSQEAKAVTDSKDMEEPVQKEEGSEEKKETDGENENAPLPPQVLIGVVRVGPAQQRLLTKGNPDLGSELVAVFNKKPTKHQLRRLANLIETNLKSPFSEKASIQVDEDGEMIIIRSEETECPYPVSISCTSPEYGHDYERELSEEADDLLSEEKCMVALAKIRRIRWSKKLRDDIELPIVRILLDFATRLPGWKYLKPYAAEVLVHTVMEKLARDVRESEHTFSRVFIQCLEVIAEGLLLSWGPGLKDPCEPNPADAFAYLTLQQAEDLTKAAQSALRFIACERLPDLLQIEP